MPNNIIKHDEKEGKGSKQSLENKWDRAGDAAEKSTGKKDDYALQNYIYHKMTGAVELNAAERLVASSGEQAIRDAVASAGNTSIGKPFPIKVNFNGRTVPFLVVISKLPSGSEQVRGVKSKLYLTTVKRGKLMRSDPETWIIDHYTLDGKDRLKPEGLPKNIDEQDAADFFRQVGMPMPK